MKYIIDYRTLEGDLAHVWLDARSKNDAKEQLRREYWDVLEIIQIKNG